MSKVLISGNKKKQNKILKWLLIIIGTPIIIVFAFFCIALVWKSYDDFKKKKFANLDPVSQRIAVYETYWSIINEKFYDEKFNGLNWNAQKAIGLEKAKKAKDKIALWNVLNGEANLFAVSHVWVEFSKENTLKPLSIYDKTVENTPKKDEFSTLPSGKFEFDPIDMGWQMSSVRRGQGSILLVGEVRPKSVAAKLGLEPGWIVDRTGIIGANTQKYHFIGDFYKIKVDNGNLKMKGSRTNFELSLDQEPNKNPEKIRIEYDFNFGENNKPLETKTISKNISYLRFDGFNDFKTAKSAIEYINQNRSHGLILDLRNNAGGTSFNTKWFLSQLIGSMKVMGKVKPRKGIKTIRAFPFGERFNSPIIVLIGPNTASAAEISAKELKIHNNALLIGRRTQGAVLTSKVRKLPDGSKLFFPVENYFSSDGNTIEGLGVQPDIEILPTSEQLNSGRDIAFEVAVTEMQKMVLKSE